MEIVGQIVTFLVIQGLYALAAYLFCRVQNKPPWLWTLGALVPFFGLIVFLVFIYRTMYSMLVRLNWLEGRVLDQGASPWAEPSAAAVTPAAQMNQ